MHPFDSFETESKNRGQKDCNQGEVINGVDGLFSKNWKIGHKRANKID